MGERLVCLADGIKAPKEGRKMPAVKLLHQQSASNSKPDYIMGHSFQAVSLLVQGPAGHVAAVPLVSRIHEGLIWSNRDTRRDYFSTWHWITWLRSGDFFAVGCAP